MSHLRVCVAALMYALLAAAPLRAQEHPTVVAAIQAYEALDFEGAVDSARHALDDRLSLDDQAAAFEILAFALATLDSTAAAIDTFEELILLDPEREPDPNIISTKITSLYALALGQVLVVRHVTVDSGTFIAGEGGTTVSYEVSRPASVTVTALGPSGEIPFAATSGAGTHTVQWTAVDPDGNPLAPGRYQIRARATAGREAYDDAVDATIEHGTVDTLPHFLRLEGYDLQPETEIPPRSFRPLGLALLYSGVASGAALLIDNTGLGDLEARQVISINAAALVVGLVTSLKRPAARPVEANIRYNQLVAEQLVRENEGIAAANANRRRQVVLTVRPLAGAGR